jgi:hypothetical protein
VIGSAEGRVPPSAPDHRQVDEDGLVNTSANFDDLVHPLNRNILERVNAFGSREKVEGTVRPHRRALEQGAIDAIRVGAEFEDAGVRFRIHHESSGAILDVEIEESDLLAAERARALHRQRRRPDTAAALYEGDDFS